MRITNISTVLYEYPFTRPIGDVHLPQGVTHGADLAVFVETDEGPTGVSIGLGASPAAVAGFTELLVGEDPRSVRGLWQRMVDATFKAGTVGAAKAAISALDCALWDLRAKAHGVPLYKELGATSDRARVYASGLDTPLSDDEVHAFYARMADRGVSAGKLKVGRDRVADERRTAVMAEALAKSGRPPVLMVDANEFWTPKQAVQRISSLEERFEFAWVEEPVRRWDHEGLRRVSDAVRAPIATGENLNLVHEYVPLVRAGAVDVVQIGMLTSGITGALQVAELAYAHDLPVAMMNCPGRMMAHLAAALPHHTMMEVLDAGRDAALVRQPPIEDGYVVLGSEPGSGLEFDLDRLEQLRVSSPSASTLGNAYRRAPDSGSIA
jgi:L-alanine-DL-glutamate epimerase-like enolase superfamily enzyme